MEESNVIKGTLVIIFGGEMLSLFWDLRWMIMLVVILVAVDFRFGVKAAQARGEKIRNSKTGRRTGNKLIDYICYLVFGGLIGKAIGEPLGVNPTLVAAVCCG